MPLAGHFIRYLHQPCARQVDADASVVSHCDIVHVLVKHQREKEGKKEQEGAMYRNPPEQEAQIESSEVCNGGAGEVFRVNKKSQSLDQYVSSAQ